MAEQEYSVRVRSIQVDYEKTSKYFKPLKILNVCWLTSKVTYDSLISKLSHDMALKNYNIPLTYREKNTEYAKPIGSISKFKVHKTSEFKQFVEFLKINDLSSENSCIVSATCIFDRSIDDKKIMGMFDGVCKKSSTYYCFYPNLTHKITFLFTDSYADPYSPDIAYKDHGNHISAVSFDKMDKPLTRLTKADKPKYNDPSLTLNRKTIGISFENVKLLSGKDGAISSISKWIEEDVTVQILELSNTEEFYGSVAITNIGIGKIIDAQYDIRTLELNITILECPESPLNALRPKYSRIYVTDHTIILFRDKDKERA